MNETTGVAIEARCKATNLCRYCQRRYVAETVEMLLLDAAENAPTLWVVLTAREHLTRKDCYAHLQQLRRFLRRRWPSIEWFVQVEFQRRGALHLNLLVKGVPTSQRAALLEEASQLWCSRVDALPKGQWAGEVTDAGGVAKYLAKTLGHGLKAEQAPPIGWKGHRTSQTRGYLVRPASEMRREARRSMRQKALLARLAREGIEGQYAELLLADELAVADASVWRLYTVDLSRVSRADAQPSDFHIPTAQLVAALQAQDAGNVGPVLDRPDLDDEDESPPARRMPKWADPDLRVPGEFDRGRLMRRLKRGERWAPLLSVVYWRPRPDSTRCSPF